MMMNPSKIVFIQVIHVMPRHCGHLVVGTVVRTPLRGDAFGEALGVPGRKNVFRFGYAVFVAVVRMVVDASCLCIDESFLDTKDDELPSVLELQLQLLVELLLGLLSEHMDALSSTACALLKPPVPISERSGRAPSCCCWLIPSSSKGCSASDA